MSEQTTNAAGDDGGCATRNAHAAVAGVPSATAPKQTTDIAEFVTLEFAEEGRLTDEEVRAFFRSALASLRSAQSELRTAGRRVDAFYNEMMKRGIFT